MGSASPERATSVPLSAVLVTDDSMGGVVSRVVVQRTAEMKSRRPDRISLERRELTEVPQLPGERQLRSLNLQHNAITTLHRAGAASDAAAPQGAALIGAQCPHIVFLDLYNNQIATLGNGLELLHELQVLILGKNRLRSVEGLHFTPLRSLDVLDLRSNLLTSAPSNGYPLFPTLAHMTKLRTLNLAGNQVGSSLRRRRYAALSGARAPRVPSAPPPHFAPPTAAAPRPSHRPPAPLPSLPPAARTHARDRVAPCANRAQLLAQCARRALLGARRSHWA
jgi:Leucine-rich repeat (LRR) protein